ncbi:MAG: peptidoglycan-binding protein [Candidatus Pacebacteria bacterium]|nr:peptidoglycan-binding protein [Candidatus Paceibacterota bacterium]
MLRQHPSLFFLGTLFFVPLLVQSYSFSRDLSLGDSGEDVRVLQQVLNSRPETIVTNVGPGSVGQETTYFGENTHRAVIRYQELYRTSILLPRGLTAGTGFVGSATRALLSGSVLSLKSSPNTTVEEALQAFNQAASGLFVASEGSVPQNSYAAPDDLFDDLVRGKIAIPPPPSMEEQIATFNEGFSSEGGPTIISISPQHGPDGTDVKLIGTGFTKTGNTVYAGFATLSNLSSSDGTTITLTMHDMFPDDAVLPDFFKKAIPHMLYGVYVENSTGHSNAIPFFITY